MPKLSIVIPTYNEEKFLPLLLRSIQAQSYTDYEIVVADNESTDRTAEIARGFGVQLTRGGDHPSKGRNCGAAVASGEILLFLDADVILPDPWFLQMTVAEFEKRRLDVATCQMEPMSERAVDQAFHDVANFYLWVTQELSPHAPGFCLFARQEIQQQLRGFDETLKMAEDHDFVIRASEIGKFGLLKTYKIPVSVRRFERDGHMNTAMKYLLVEVYRSAKGKVKEDLFDYGWGHGTFTKEQLRVEAEKIPLKIE